MMVSAVILNYKDPELTCRCIDKLHAAADESGVETEVIVVDNSAPQTAQSLHEGLSEEVIIIENEKNEGFSKANNQGIERAKGDLILIMNNDLFINADTLGKGVRYIKNHPNIGVWAPKLTDQQGNAQRSCSQFPTLTGLISEYLLKLQYDNRIAKYAISADKPIKVDTVIGACMLIPKTVLDEVEGFDEDYFFNVEDVDLCLKIKNCGYEVIFDSRCSAVHLVSASQNGHWHDNRYLHQARILYFRKNHNSLKSGIAKAVIKAGIQLRKIKHQLLPG
jgi:GT2 family glycosyltransferase